MREMFHVRVDARRCREGRHGGVDRDAETCLPGSKDVGLEPTSIHARCHARLIPR